MKTFKKLLLIIIFGLLISPLTMIVKAENNITLYLFYDETCYHCHLEQAYLDELETQYSNINVQSFEVVTDSDNAALFQKVEAVFERGNGLTPFLVVGGVAFSGYNDNVKSGIVNAIEYYTDNSFTDVVQKVINNQEVLPSDLNTIPQDTVTIPIIGEVNKSSFSLLVGAIVIGFVDGFNPCAMWILIFLMTMLVNLRDRKRMWIIGLTFILTSGIVYGLIMISLFQASRFISLISWMRIFVGAFAMAFGVYNVYTFIKSLKKDDGCVVTDEPKRKKLLERIKKITASKSLWIALGGVIVLAATVNIIELACSAGLPYLYTQLLAYNDLSSFSYIIYILIYLFFFLLNEIIIFVIAMITFKVTGISNKYTKYSHIIGAIIMLVIGFLLIFFPNIIMFN